MHLMPIVYAFIIALVGGVAVGMRPGYPFESILLGATIAAAMTGLAATMVQFVPQRYFVLAASVGGALLGLVAGQMLGWARVLDFGPVRGPFLIVLPVAIVAGLLLSRATGMRLPSLRRRRPGLQR